MWRLLQDALLRTFGALTGPEPVLYYRNPGASARSGTARCQRARVPRGGSGEIREGPGVVGVRLLVAEGTPAERSLGGVGGLPNLSRPRGASGHRPGQGRSTRLPGLPR